MRMPRPATYNVSLTAKGPGGSNATNVVGAVTVYARPVLGSRVLSGGSLTFSGTGGIPDVQYRILTSHERGFAAGKLDARCDQHVRTGWKL